VLLNNNFRDFCGCYDWRYDDWLRYDRLGGLVIEYRRLVRHRLGRDCLRQLRLWRRLLNRRLWPVIGLRFAGHYIFRN
jgi:hypothetical protein